MNSPNWSEVPVSDEDWGTPPLLAARSPKRGDAPRSWAAGETFASSAGRGFSRVLALLAVVSLWTAPWTLLALNNGSPALGVVALVSSLFLAAGAARCGGLGEALLIGLLVYGMSAVLIPNLLRRPCGGTLTACKSNLKSVGTALEMYSTDNGGHYPAGLARLAPNYLKTIPTCPSAGSDTYSLSFRSADGPDLYTSVCAGGNHTDAGVAANYPQYSSVQGLLERP